MRERVRRHWKFTTFLFIVAIVECTIVALYLAVDLSRPARVTKAQNSLSVFGIHSALPPAVEARQLTLGELFEPASGIEKRLPKLLHDYFRETHRSAFSSLELVGLLGFEPSKAMEVTLQRDEIIFRINPHNPASTSEGLQSIAISKELLANELRDEYKTSGSLGRAVSDYEITTLPAPGNTIVPQEKMLSLTFDDGPDGSTHALLDALAKYEANATFFVLGQKVAGGVGVLQRMIRDGHEIGNHSWSHPDLRLLPAEQVHSQIVDTQNAIKNATGVAPTLMRPPYGATNPAIEAAVRSQGLHQAMWSIDSNDWRNKDPELLYQRIMTSAADGKVILLHDIHSSSVEAAVRAIPDLKAQGYQLVTMSQIEALR